MKVILYVESPDDFRNAQVALEWAISEPDTGTSGCTHSDGKSSVFLKRPSGTYVIHVQPNETT